MRPSVTRRRLVTGAAAVIALVALVAGASAAAAVRLAPTNTTPSFAAPLDVGPAAIGGGTTEAKFVPIVPCRIVDTRGHGDKIQPENYRMFVAEGVNLSGQGGKAGGCGIPHSATGLEATITAVVPAGTGFLRVYPSDSAEPLATFLNYNNANIGSTGSFKISMEEDYEFTIKAHLAATSVVVDVFGYYEPPMAGYVSPTGTLLTSKSSRIVSASRATGYATGGYAVKFDRNVSDCMYTVMPYGGYAFTRAQPLGGAPDTVIVITTQPSNSAQFLDVSFHITVTC